MIKKQYSYGIPLSMLAYVKQMADDVYGWAFVQQSRPTPKQEDTHTYIPIHERTKVDRDTSSARIVKEMYHLAEVEPFAESLPQR